MSGLNQRFTKPPALNWAREFESHILRKIATVFTNGLNTLRITDYQFNKIKMKENFEQPALPEDLRKKEVKIYLSSLTHKRPILENEIVTMVEGKYANKGLKVVMKNIDGTVSILPTPESTEPETVQENELFDFEDFNDAYRAALEKFPFTTEELLGFDQKTNLN